MIKYEVTFKIKELKCIATIEVRHFDDVPGVLQKNGIDNVISVIKC